MLSSATPLCSLTEWSVNHIRDIFEAPTNEQALQAIGYTFADNVDATLNGTPLSRSGIERLVIAMRQSSPRGLQVHWKHHVEVAKDPCSNRDGSFGGFYIITGLQKLNPETKAPSQYARHKTVTVKIESQSSDPNVDSRRIVNLVFVASDFPVV